MNCCNDLRIIAAVHQIKIYSLYTGDRSLKKKTEKQKKMLKFEKIDGYKQNAAAAWLFLILAVLPLYMRDGFNMIGDAKYIFFRNVSGFFVLISAVLVLLNCILGIKEHLLKGFLDWNLSAADKFLFVFAGSSILATAFSAYRNTAVMGFPGWYMGLFTQILIITGYFVVSRWYIRDETIELLILVSISVVSLLGVLNRYEMDPLNVYTGMDRFEWNRSNLLSTIGNINWFCGYLSVAVPVLVGVYWSSAGYGLGSTLRGIGTLFGISALLVQGSDSGYASLIMLLVVLFCGSVGNKDKMCRFLEVAMMPCLTCLLITMIKGIFGVGLFLPRDSNVEKIVFSTKPVYLFVFLLIIYIFTRFRKEKVHKDSEIKMYKKITEIVLLTAAGILVVIFVVCQFSPSVWKFLGELSLLRFDDQWGSWRGYLWKVSWESFLDNGIFQKLFGVGPDCFAEYLYDHYTLEINISGQFQGAVFANAHNEWLNMLINEGLFGAVSYLGFFAAAFLRFYRRIQSVPSLMSGTLAVAVYCTNSFFSFQQVTSTPLIFLTVGACEALIVRKSLKNVDVTRQKTYTGS